MSWLYKNNAMYVSLQLTIRYHEGCTALQGHTNISVGIYSVQSTINQSWLIWISFNRLPFDLKKVFPISMNSVVQIYSIM